LGPVKILAELRVMKVCPSCSREFTRSGWEELKLVGIQPPLAPGEPTLELRNCYCRSTIAVEKS